MPQVGHDESAKQLFWEDLDHLVRVVPSSEKLFIGGDLNGHVGISSAGFEAVHGVLNMVVGTRRERKSWTSL